MKRRSFDTVLGLLALLTFAATRFIGLAQYPIYFFSDEAANIILTAELIAKAVPRAALPSCPVS